MPELLTGRLTPLTSRVSRLLAPNPSWETGPGTNTYLLGTDDVTVVDPGPADVGHIEAIIAQSPGRIRHILVTHTHEDHSPGAALLAERTGAQVLGCAVLDDEWQDTSYRPQRVLRHDEQLELGGVRLRAVHTPGHVGNHLCYLVEDDELLITGDHIMNGSTVVIVPPSGDMADYLASLALLRQYPLRSLAPGHGDLMEQPQATVDYLIQHRLRREAKVLDCVRRTGPGTLEDLLPVAYDDVASNLHGLASLSLWAHLLKLVRDGQVVEEAGVWRLVE